MAYLTLSGAVDTDPYFDPKSLRPDYGLRHEIIVDIQSQPIKGVDLTADYRACVRYSLADLPSFDVLRVELLLERSTEDRRRGRPQLSRLPSGVEIGLAPLFAWDAEHGPGREQVLDAIEQHQADRDEDLAAARGGDL